MVSWFVKAALLKLAGDVGTEADPAAVVVGLGLVDEHELDARVGVADGCAGGGVFGDDGVASVVDVVDVELLVVDEVGVECESEESSLIASAADVDDDVVDVHEDTDGACGHVEDFDDALLLDDVEVVEVAGGVRREDGAVEAAGGDFGGDWLRAGGECCGGDGGGRYELLEHALELLWRVDLACASRRGLSQPGLGPAQTRLCGPLSERRASSVDIGRAEASLKLSVRSWGRLGSVSSCAEGITGAFAGQQKPWQSMELSHFERNENRLWCGGVGVVLGDAAYGQPWL